MGCLEKEMECERWLYDEGLQDRFFLKSGEKNVIFVFENGGKWPKAVMKFGKSADVEKEYSNHKRASILFPQFVPKIYFFESNGGTANLCMEYVRDCHFGSSISSFWRGKRKRYLYEIGQIFSFLIAFLKHIPVKKGNVDEAYSPEKIEAMTNDVLDCFDGKVEIRELKKMIDGVRKTQSPVILQHRDFSVSNVIYADRQRKVIIDWEDSKEDDLPMVDFNMLLISMICVYSEMFHEAEDHFFGNADIIRIVRKKREEIRQYFGLEEGPFEKISQLSTLSLCSQNIHKGRFKTAEKIFAYLVREVNQRGTLWT